MPPLRLLLFFVAFASLDIGLHVYVWRRAVRDPRWPPRWHRVGTGLVVLAAAAMPVSMALVRGGWVRAAGAHALHLVSFGWMGVLFYLVVFFGAVDLARAVRTVWRRVRSRARAAAPVDPERRAAVARLVAGGVGAATGALAVGAWRGETSSLDTPLVEVALPRWPRQFDGLRIVQLSDLHVGPLLGERFARHVAAVTRGLRPDLLVVTGDVVDGSVGALAPLLAPLAHLEARFGTWFVTGNHEFYSGAPAWVAAFRRMGWRVLQGERAWIRDGKAAFELAGVDDPAAEWIGWPGPRESIDRALVGASPDHETILLAHRPKAIERAAWRGAGLQLSGHTHGGQMWPFAALTALAQPYLSGLHLHANRTWIYVSRGVGTWGPPMRVLAPAEIPVIVVRRG